MTAEFRWAPMTVAEIAELFSALQAPWWLAGGWAVDAFVGRTTRGHGDIDIAVLRRDQPYLWALLRTWDIRVAHDGVLTPWDGHALVAPRHQFWVRHHGDESWRFEILLEDTAGDAWLYRRDPRIAMPLADLGRVDAHGVPYLRPALALLYKSPAAPAAAAERNAADFDACAPVLPESDRAWLKAVLPLVAPDHPWLDRL